MNAPMIRPAPSTDHILPRIATEKAEISHLPQALGEVQYLKTGRPARHVL